MKVAEFFTFAVLTQRSLKKIARRAIYYTALIVIVNALGSFDLWHSAGSGPFAGLLRTQAAPGVAIYTVANFPGADAGAKANGACAAADGAPGQIVFGAGTSVIDTTIALVSNCWFIGQGDTATILTAGPTLGINRIFYGQGTSASHVTQARVSNLKIQNGTPGTGTPPSGPDGIRCNYCDYFQVDHVWVTSIQGYYGIVLLDNTYASVHDDQVDHFGVAGIENLTALGASYNQFFNNNIHDAMSTTEQTFGMGACDFSSVNPVFCSHTTVRNTVVTNVPHWNCFDSHGGTDTVFDHVTAENCYVGLQAGMTGHFPATDVQSNLSVTNSTFTRGTGDPNNCGIVSKGGISGTTIEMVQSPVYQGNTITGFGSTSTGSDAYEGGICIAWTNGAQIVGNTFPSIYQSDISLVGPNWSTAIESNIFGDILGAYAMGAEFSVNVLSPGNWMGLFDQNQIKATEESTAPYGMLNSTMLAAKVKTGPQNSANFLEGGATNLWHTRYLPLNLAKLPSSAAPMNFEPGDLGYDTSYLPAAGFAGPANKPLALEIYSTDTTDVLFTGHIASGSTTLNVTKGSANVGICGGASLWYYCVTPGSAIVIPGAGPTGLPLITTVVGILSTNQIQVANQAFTSVTSQRPARITWDAGSITAIGVKGLYTVSSGTPYPSLPACNSTSNGSVLKVADATNPVWNAPFVGGGNYAVNVLCNGTNWVAN